MRCACPQRRRIRAPPDTHRTVTDAPRDIAAVVLNFNGGEMVIDCIETLRAQVPPVEVVCVDNGSVDGSADAVAERFPDVRVVRLGKNFGFAGGMNRGIAATASPFVALVNSDVLLEPDYFAQCHAALGRGERRAGVTGKLLRATPSDPPIIDTTGHTVYRNRRAVDRGEREPDAGQYDQEVDLFSICAAAALYRRDALDDVAVDGEYFDEDFFAYFEDLDLCWRAQMRGWRFAYTPGAVGRHIRHGSGGRASTFILACNYRNRLLVMLRNDVAASFFRHFGGIAYTELRAVLNTFWLRPAALFRAWFDFFRLVPSQLKRRRQIQRRRTVDWQTLEPWFEPYDYGVRAIRRRARERAELG